MATLPIPHAIAPCAVKIHSGPGGYTLVEVCLSIFVALIIGLITAQFAATTSNASDVISGQARLQSDMAVVLQTILTDVESATVEAQGTAWVQNCQFAIPLLGARDSDTMCLLVPKIDANGQPTIAWQQDGLDIIAYDYAVDPTTNTGMLTRYVHRDPYNFSGTTRQDSTTVLTRNLSNITIPAQGPGIVFTREPIGAVDVQVTLNGTLVEGQRRHTLSLTGRRHLRN